VNVDTAGLRKELERIVRVSDLLTTAHAGLRDRNSFRALLLDLSILAISTWLVALAFIEPRINATLTPLGVDPQLWAGSLAILVFLLTLVQIKTDWKSRADAHRRAVDLYSEVKREARYLIATGIIEESEWRRVLARYDLASSVAVTVPEAEFLTWKRRHRTKVEMSRYLDDFPTASPLLLRLRWWFRDNFRRDDNV
jgi:hypothetical protein